MKVLWGNVIVKPITDEKTESGMYLPEEAQSEPVKKGLVTAIGSGSTALSGNLVPLEVQIGATVLYKTHNTYKIKYDGLDQIVVEQRDIICEL